jgi:hypothetical protein
MQHKLSTMTGALIVLAALTLTGCATGGGSATSAPAATTAATPTPTPTPTQEPVLDLGDAIVKTGTDGKPVVITDAAGKYQKITINPEAKVLQLDPSVLDEPIAAAGWSDDAVLSAQQWLMTFVAEQALDSIAADGPTGWDEWKATQATSFVAPEWADVYESNSRDRDQNFFMQNNTGLGIPTMVRDGAPRVSGTTLSLTTVRATDLEGTPLLVFEGGAVTDYRVTDAERLATLQRLNPDATDAAIIESSPKIDDGVDEDYTVELTYIYAVRQDAASGWLITGYENTFKDSGV